MPSWFLTKMVAPVKGRSGESKGFSEIDDYELLCFVSVKYLWCNRSHLEILLTTIGGMKGFVCYNRRSRRGSSRAMGG
jgi:hypothetical protein